MDRKQGYYWVKLPHNDSEFEPAKYTVSGFWLLNGKMYYEDADFAEIDEKMIVRKDKAPILIFDYCLGDGKGDCVATMKTIYK